jgi:tetratricopeptide (TPR) repeat protein
MVRGFSSRFRSVFDVRLILVFVILAASVFTPPVPKGVARDGRALNPTEIALPSEKETWFRVESEHFTIISSDRESETRELAEDLEAAAVVLQKLHPRFRLVPLARSRVLLFASRGESQPYFDLLLSHGTRAPGAFVEGEEGGTMVLLAGRRPDRVPFHELVHKLFAGPTRPPLWLEEGLAEHYSYIRFFRDELSIGIRPHIVPPFRGIRPMTQLFAVKRDADLTSNTAFYRQSLAAVDWLLRTDPAAFDAFERDLESGMPAEAALMKHYQATPERVQQGIAGFGKSTPMVRPRPPLAQPIASQALTRPELLYELGSFLGQFESTRTDAERHFRAALNSDPRHARSLAGLGVLRAKAKELDTAIPFFEKAIAIAPDDPPVLLAYAEALLGNAIGAFAGTLETDPEAPVRYQKARGLAQHALDRGADPARASGDLGVALTLERDVTPSLAPLERAYRLTPSRVDFALQLYAMYLRAGHRDKADALSAELPHDSQTTFATKSILLRELTARANALLAEQKFDDAIAIIGEMIAATPDPTARADLERQAAQLTRTADANREIIKYNEAVAQLGRGQRKEALATLDALLKTAADAQVIEDATHLRDELRKTR